MAYANPPAITRLIARDVSHMAHQWQVLQLMGRSFLHTGQQQTRYFIQLEAFRGLIYNIGVDQVLIARDLCARDA